jgi:signal transduction histidine kinase
MQSSDWEVLSEITSLVAHEFNNYLNGILLHVALLEQELAPAARPELGVIRKLSHEAADLVKRLQQFNQREIPALQPVDLNGVVRESLAKLHAPGQPLSIRQELPSELPPVLAAPDYLERLVTLVVTNSLAVSIPGQGAVTVRTKHAGQKVLVVVEDSGPHVAADRMAHVFEPFAVGRAGEDGIRLPVSKLLARRLQGTIRADNRPEGGMAFEIELNRAPSS